MINDLNLSQKILNERRKRGLTQEELANALGVSAQAVSNWERGGYPDITMLPGIANYFKITIDELLGNDTTGQKEDIRQFFDRYFELKRTNNTKEALRLSLEYARKYPQKYGIATLAADAIAQLPPDQRSEHLPTLRSLCDRVISEATNQGVRNFAIRIMCSVCADDEVDKWYDMCPPIYNACLCEVKEERFWIQNKPEDSRRQFDINNLVILFHFLFRPHRNQGDPKRTLALYQFRLRTMDLLRIDGILPAGWIGHYAELQCRLACAIFLCGEKEKGYQTLEASLDLLSEWAKIPDNTPLELGDPFIFGGVQGVKGRSILVYPDGTQHHERLERGFKPLSLYQLLTSVTGLDSVRSEPRFISCLNKAKEIENQ